MTSKSGKETVERVAADSNVILSALVGKAALRVFTRSSVEVFTTARVLDEIRHGLGLRQVEFTVEKGALGKLAGTREPGVQLEHPLEQHVEHHWATVTMQLQHVLARVRTRRGKPQCNAAVERCARGITKGGILGMSWGRQPPEQRRCNRAHRGARHAHDADTAAPRRSRHSGDGFRLGVCGARDYFARAAIMRVICHCWAIDKMLLTTQ